MFRRKFGENGVNPLGIYLRQYNVSDKAFECMDGVSMTLSSLSSGQDPFSSSSKLLYVKVKLVCVSNIVHYLSLLAHISHTGGRLCRY